MSIMADLRPWTDDVVKDYLTATAQQKDDPQKFYDTHLDIDQIYAEFLPRHQATFVTQEEFRDELVDAPIDDDIRTFILRGETGSGKSQLCQWLDYELEGVGQSEGAPDRIPLHIKANQTNLEHIISTLAKPLGEDPEIRQVTELDAAKVAEAIITNLEANPGQKLADADIDRIIQTGELKSMLTSNIRTYQEGLEASDETDFDPNLISKEDYRDIALKLGTESVFHQNRNVLRQALRDEIHRHFSHVIGVDDFQGQLREYAQRYVEELGKRPVIICEDVTTFSVLKEQLLDQIIQVESATYDIVLGYTTGFEQDDLQDALGTRGDQDALTYLKDRSEGYLSLTNEGVTYFLNTTLSVELVRKYLDVIKRESGASIDEEVESAFDELYPFNRAFIQVVYDRLLEEGSPRRTPRVLLQKVVRRVLLSDEPPYEVVGKNPNVDNMVTPIDPSFYSNPLQNIAKWYGYRDEVRDDSEEILIHQGILDTFDIQLEDDTVSYEGAEYVSLRPNEAVSQLLDDSAETRPSIPPSQEPVPDTPEGPGGEAGSHSQSQPGSDQGTETRTTGTGPPPRSRSEGQARKEDQINEFYEWIETGDSYPSSEVLKSGAETILETWHDPTRLANSNSSRTSDRGIYYTRGDDVPVSIEGPDERDGLSVLLPFGKKHMDLYYDILTVGIGDEEGVTETANIEQLRCWATNSVVEFRSDMRTQVESCLPPDLTFEQTLLLGKFLLANAEFGRTDWNRSLVFDRTVPTERTYSSPVRTAFGNGSGLRTTLGELQDYRREIDGLIDGFFLLKKNLIDHDRLQPVQSAIAEDPDRYLRLAHEIDTEKLDYPSAYNIGSSRSNANTGVVGFLDAISDYSIELTLLTEADLEEHFESALQPVTRWHDPNHRVDELEAMLETLLSTLGTFGETKSESWETVHDELADADTSIDLTGFSDAVTAFKNPTADSPIERMAYLHEFQTSRETHLGWDLYRTFDELIARLSDYNIDESEDLRGRIQELDALDDFESARGDVIDAIHRY